MTSRTNIATGDVRDFSYDVRNRLVNVVDHPASVALPFSQSINYTYDMFDRRIGRQVSTMSIDGGEGNDTTASQSSETYVYDGDHVVLDYLDTDGPGSAAPILKSRYLYGPAVDQVLAQEDVTQDLNAPRRVLWPESDNLGSIRDVIDNTGHLASHFTYDAFGQVLSGDTSLGRYFFTGRELDPLTGLQYNRENWYDSSTGRWIGEDKAHATSNDYAYVGGSPTNATDPQGLWGEPVCVECVPRYRNHQIIGGMGRDAGGLGTAEELRQGAEIAATIGSIFCEPVDWAMTAREIWNDPWSGWSYAGLIPMVPAGAGKLGKALGKADNAVEAVAEAAIKNASGQQGIYEFADALAGGKPYVGQSGDISQRLSQHRQAGRLADNTVVKMVEVQGDKTAREVAEYLRIQEITGGVPAGMSRNVANQRNPIGPNRQYLLDPFRE